MNIKQPTPPLFFLFALILMAMMHKFLPGFSVFTGTISVAIGFMFICFGASMLIWADKTLKKVGASLSTVAESTKLVKDGPYSYCRNPMYLGMVLILFGIFFILGSSTTLIVVLLFGGVMEDKFIRPEEKMMIQKFGKEYIEYSFKVSKWFPLLTEFTYEKRKKDK